MDCFLCDTQCDGDEYQWQGSGISTLSWYTCKNCSSFGITILAKVGMTPNEKKKLAMFAYKRRNDAERRFLLYSEDSELQEDWKNHSDPFKLDELVSRLEADGSTRKRPIGF
jgi:hypothetical protein